MAQSTERDPRYDVKLTKSSTTVSLKLCNNRGEDDPLAVQQQQTPGTAIKMAQGNTEHSDYEPPFASEEQRDWSVGRGLENGDDEEGRFLDVRQLQTQRPGKVILQGQPKYGTGYRDADTNMWDTRYEWYDDFYTPAQGYRVSTLFTAGASYTTGRIQVVLKMVGSPASGARISIWSDDGSDKPNALLAGASRSLSEANIATPSIVNVAQAIVSGTKYHLVVYDSGDTWDGDNYYVPLCSSDDGNRWTGSAWSTSTVSPYFRITEADSHYKALFFDYAEVPHCVIDYDDEDTAPKIFRNGDYGVPSSVTSTTIVDSTKSWTVDAWIGATVAIAKGPGAESTNRFYTITDNDATSITVSGWDVTPLAGFSLYAIIDTDIWLETTGHGMRATNRVTDVEVAGNIAYIARGGRNHVISMRYPELSGGAFTTEMETVATFIKVAPNTQKDRRLWISSRRDGGAYIDKSKIPWGSLSNTYGSLDWGYGVSVTNGSMEADSSWTAVGTPTTEERSSDQAHNGTYSWKIVSDADSEGITQTISDLIIGDTYEVSCWVYMGNGSANGCELKFGGTQMKAASETEVWIHLKGTFTATATSHAFEILADGGVATFYVDDCFIKKQYTTLQDIGDEKITGMISYGDPERLHVATTGGVYMETNGKFTGIPIKELKNVKDERNGRSMVVQDVYLFFSFLDGLERYFKGNLDDVGPNRDEGLPAGRRGHIADMVGYPTGIFCAYDAGTSGTSSVLFYNNRGFHEVYRAPTTGERIRGLHIQTIDSDELDKLWINVGSDLVSIPIDLNPQTNSDYKYNFEGWIETSFSYRNKHDVLKYYHQLKLYVENKTGDYYIVADYKLDEDTTWTSIGTFNDAGSPHESANIGSYNVEGRRIRFRYRMVTHDPTETPELLATVVDLVEDMPTKDRWTFQFRLEDNVTSIQGAQTHNRIEDTISQLNTWKASPVPIKFESKFSSYDVKYASIISFETQPIYIHSPDQKEIMIGTITLAEV